MILTIIHNIGWSVEVHGHCRVSNWQSFTLVKFLKLLWIFILIFLSLLGDWRQGTELCLVVLWRLPDVVDGSKFLLFKVFTALRIDKANLKIGSILFQSLKTFVVSDHILSIFLRRSFHSGARFLSMDRNGISELFILRLLID